MLISFKKQIMSKKIESMRNQTKRSLAFIQTVETLTKLIAAMTKFSQKTKIKLIKNMQLQIAETYKKNNERCKPLL